MLCRVCFHPILHQISDLWTLLYLYLLTSCFVTYVLFLQSPALILSYHEYSLLDITCYISTCFVCLRSRHDFQCMIMIRFYRYTCAYLCTPSGILITTRWGVLTPLDPHIQVSKLGACRFSQLLIRETQR